MYKQLALAVVTLLFVASTSAEIRISVVDNNNNPLSNIVVELNPKASQPVTVAPNKTIVMKQLNQQFVPHILAVQKGSVVAFPNTDTVMHHVYSFSQAKTFEVRIYKEELDRKVTFDKAGVASLGCNIHDWMLGYVYVANSPLFGLSDEKGEVIFSSIAHGEYTASVWHPRIDERDLSQTHSAHLLASSDTPHEIKISLVQALLPSLSEFDDVNSLQGYD